MFFRRGRLPARKARALLIELFNQRYQWPLRSPIVHLMARGDPLRFLCSVRFLVDQIGAGVYLLNQRKPPERTAWCGENLEALAELPGRPDSLVERLVAVMAMDDAVLAEREVRRLLLEIIDLAPKLNRRGQDEEQQPIVSWLPHVADVEAPVEPPHPSPAEAGKQPAELRRLAQRAVRIVWRLPGSRLAALTGSVAAGYADLTSDLDISLFGVKFADPAVRRSLIAATSDAPTDITQLTHPTHAADAFWLDGRLVDVRYFLIERARRLIENPIPESGADEELLARLSSAETLVDYEFRGPELVRDLQRATRRTRAERVARASTGLDNALNWLVDSSDSASIFHASVDAILAFFQLLAAHNDRWIVFPKWTAAWLEELAYVPADVHARLSAIALLPFRPEHVPARLETWRALALETQRYQDG